ncbi:MAG: histidinol-phosphate transaminase [Anaerolineae bacterium]|nr:histidinol-phosphate transaminase [Anaerolineae bacterium]
MIADVEQLVSPHVRAMQPYTPIVPLDVLSQRLGIAPEAIVKLDANENPYGPSPRALEALARAQDLNLYPDPDQTHLREAIGAFIGVDPAHILCGAGSDEVIALIVHTFVRPEDAILDLPPTFGMYRWQADALNARYVPIPRRADFSIDLDSVQRAVAQTPSPRLLFVADPNNPDGSATSDEVLCELLKLPVIVVLDEAYIEFSGRQSRVGWVLEHPNLIVLRTFSKLAGMAGLRVGYGVFPTQIVAHVWKVKPPYTPNAAGMLAAAAALSDREHLDRSVACLVAERERLRAALSAFSWLRVYPSQANFLLCHVEPTLPIAGGDPSWTAARRLKHALEQRGVLVRYFDKDGLRDCIRISVGKPEHTDRLLAVLREVVG